MKVKDVMTRDVQFVETNDTLQAAAIKMRELDIGDLPVMLNGDPVGFITDRDLAIKAVAHGLIPETARVVDAMTEKLIMCREDDDIEQAVDRMIERKVRRLGVADQDGNLCGIISLGDIAAKAEEHMAGKILRRLFAA